MKRKLVSSFRPIITDTVKSLSKERNRFYSYSVNRDLISESNFVCCYFNVILHMP